MGWAGARNGILLALAARKFDAFVTTDKNIQYQQNLSRLPVSVVILSAYSNALPALLPLVPKLDVALASLNPRSLVIVTSDDTIT